MDWDASSGKRDWRVENLSRGLFVRRMDEDPWKDMYDSELEIMNRDKVGAPYRVPDSVIRTAMLRFGCSGKGYREIAAEISLRLGKLGLPGISYSQLKKRSDKLSIHLGITDVTDARVIAFGSGGVTPDPSSTMTIAIDSTGMSPDHAAGWMTYHWNMKEIRSWMKLHVAVNTNTNEILAYVITSEHYGDNLAFDRLMDIVLGDGHRVAAVYADAAYDAKDNWNRMKGLGISFVANIRGCLNKFKRSANSGRRRGCMERAKHVRYILDHGKEEWKEWSGYGKRWKVESTFSDVKRMFGDTIRARGPDGVANILYWIIRAFNLYKKCRLEIGGQ